jgi:DNA mismatch repair protein MutL
MSRIHVLPEKLANLIAAGEVVERPASVVKELVENALDAQARRIEVEIQAAGFESMRITDDGTGMLPEDARLAFQRHATSKLNQPEDLEKIMTLGFRGEALPSIAVVSRLELLTCPQEQSSGFRIALEAGVVKSEGEAGSAPGTSILVQDLFFNTPARRKFMKSAATEQSHIIRTIELAALAHPEVRFLLKVDGREIFNCPATDDLKERLASLYGKSLPQELLALDYEAGPVQIRGYVSGPGATRQTRQGMVFFINQRPVEHRGIAHAVQEAFRTLIPEGRYPNCYLFLNLQPDLVDVNVHPAKREVRLRDEHAVHQAVFAAVRQALSHSDLSAGGRPQALTGKTDAPAAAYGVDPGSGWSDHRVKESVATYLGKLPLRFGEFRPSNPEAGFSGHLDPQNPEPGFAEREKEEAVQILGQVGRTYIAGQDAEGFFLIDQHAGHERLLYEKYCQWTERVPRQSLLLPLTLELSPSQTSLLTSLLPALDQIGFELSPLGGSTYSVNSQPDFLEKGDPSLLIMEMLEAVADNGKMPPLELRDKLMKSLACHSAIRAGERLQPEQMRNLAEQLLHFPCLPTCPHGRPFLFRLGWDELDRLFKRPSA